MSTKADRIRWLAELSAERREFRRQNGCNARYAVWWQTGQSLPRLYSVAPLVQKRDRLRPGTKAFAERETRFTMIIGLQQNVCYLCGEDMGDVRSTKEHVLPRAKNGRDGRNLLAAHKICNWKKADRDPHPCELIYLEAINIRMDRVEARLESRAKRRV